MFENGWLKIVKEENEYCGHDHVQIATYIQPQDFTVLIECLECPKHQFIKSEARIAAALLPHFAPDLVETAPKSQP